jgi:hypothetical protein
MGRCAWACVIQQVHAVCVSRACCCLQDCPLKQSLLQQAADKLRSSIQFSRADPAPHNALGDVLMDAAELVVNLASVSSSSSSGAATGFGGAVALQSAVAEQAAALLKQAVDEGYMAALTISRTNADALVRGGSCRQAELLSRSRQRAGSCMCSVTQLQHVCMLRVGSAGCMQAGGMAIHMLRRICMCQLLHSSSAMHHHCLAN